MSNKSRPLFVFFCKILNWSPVFHVSCDDRYGSYSAYSNVRFSALAVSIGLYKIYFLTRFDGRFAFFFILSFRSAAAYPSIELVEQKSQEYYALMQSDQKTDQELEVHYEFLKESYNNACASKSSMLSKTSSHASTYLVLAGFYAYVFNEIWNLDGWQKHSASFFIFCGVLFLLTSGVFIFSLLQVSSEIRSTFTDLKKSEGSIYLKQAKSAYENWYASKEENKVLASKIKNIELNMIVSFLVVAAVWVFVFASGNKTDIKENSDLTANLEIKILNGSGELEGSSLNEFIGLLNNYKSHSVDRYVIFSSNFVGAEVYSSLVGLAKAVAGRDNISEFPLSSSYGLKNRVIVKIKNRDVK